MNSRFVLRRLALLGILALAVGGACANGPENPPASVLVITGATLFDGVQRELVKDATVVVRAGRIEQVVRGTLPQVPAGATVVNLGGRVLLPGLIDTHTHIYGPEQARTALEWGVTTVRNLGSQDFRGVGLRELIRAGTVMGPDILDAGYHINNPIRLPFFLDEPGLGDLMDKVEGAENLRRVVRAQVRRGVDVIKVMATGAAAHPPTADPYKSVFSLEELQAVVDEAQKAGRFVAAHAHGDEGAARAVRAGVRSIEHGTFMSDATLDLMKERGTYLVPTLTIVHTFLQQDPRSPGDITIRNRTRFMWPRLRALTAKAYARGIKIAAATDGAYGSQGTESTLRIQHELEDLVGAGLTPVDALRAATSVAAEMLGRENEIGAIKPGLQADLIAVDGNPLEDIMALNELVLIVKRGVIVKNRLPAQP